MGKLKRAKARKDPAPAPQTSEATVGELLAALEAKGEAPSNPGPGSAAEASVAVEASEGVDASPVAEPSTPPEPFDPDDLGLDGYDDGEVLEPPPEEPAAVEPRADGVELSDTLPMAPEDDLSRVAGQASPRLVSVLESLLFASDRPLTVRDLRRVLKEPTVRQVQLALKHLQATTADRGVVLSQVAGGFRLRTNPNNARWVQRLLAGKPARLSRSQLEALAVIAYRQPITKAEIDHVRGVDCGAVLRVLLERDLARIVGRKEEPGRPHLYGTTVEFLEFFNLRSLRDMPDLHEFRELTEESRSTLRAELGDDAEEVEAEVLGQEVLSFDDAEDSGEGEGEGENAEAEADADEGVGPDASEVAQDEPAPEASAEPEADAEPEPDGELDPDAEPDPVMPTEAEPAPQGQADAEPRDDDGSDPQQQEDP